MLNRDANRVPKVIAGLGSQAARKATPVRQAAGKGLTKTGSVTAEDVWETQPDHYSRQTSAI